VPHPSPTPPPTPVDLRGHATPLLDWTVPKMLPTASLSVGQQKVAQRRLTIFV